MKKKAFSNLWRDFKQNVREKKALAIFLAAMIVISFSTIVLSECRKNDSIKTEAATEQTRGGKK